MHKLPLRKKHVASKENLLIIQCNKVLGKLVNRSGPWRIIITLYERKIRFTTTKHSGIYPLSQHTVICEIYNTTPLTFYINGK